MTWSLSFDGLDSGRRDLGSSPAAGPSTVARLRSSENDVREMSFSAVHEQAPPKPRGQSVTTKTTRAVTDVLIQDRHLCPATLHRDR